MTTSRNLLALSLTFALLLCLAGATGYWLGQRHHSVVPAASSMATSRPERKPLYWFDPMQPNQHFDKPGRSPFMDMQLVPKYAEESELAPRGIRIDPGMSQALGVRVATVVRGALSEPIEVPGSVTIDERAVAVVQARAAGFVTRVYPLAPGDTIAAGAPLVDLLVPDWAGAQAEFLALLSTGDQSLLSAARQRLTLVGMPEDLIRIVERERRPLSTITIRVPQSGVIDSLDVRAGMTVIAGATLARINGLVRVWVEAAIPEAQASIARVERKVSVSLSAYPAEHFDGRVIALLPQANLDTRTLRLRLELDNPHGRLRPGMFADVHLVGGKTAPVLSVPAEAVIRTGTRAVVIVSQDDGRYLPTEVRIGSEMGGQIVVEEGLREGQKVVASGQFLIDSEASLKGVLARLNGTRPVTPAGSAP